MPKQYPRRKSPRLRDFDYSQPGAYFVTICTQNRKHMFGRVVDSEMLLNNTGLMIEQTWRDLADKYPSTRLDAFVVMPNHVHALIWLVDQHVGMDPSVHPANSQHDNIGPVPVPIPTDSPSLSDVIRWFKSFTIARYRHGVKDEGWAPFSGRLWQHSFYDHIVRRDEALYAIRRYIADNPARWRMDVYNPEAVESDPRAAGIWRMLNEKQDFNFS